MGPERIRQIEARALRRARWYVHTHDLKAEPPATEPPGKGGAMPETFRDKGRTELEIRFGALAPKLRRQLEQQGLFVPRLTQHQHDADAIARLFLRGMLTPGQTEHARRRLLKLLGSLAIHRTK